MSLFYKKTFLVSFLILIGLGLFFSLNKQATNSRQLPNNFLFRQRAFPTGVIKTAAYKNALVWKKNSLQRSTDAVTWEFVGPTNIGGRITDIEIPSNNAATYYVGSASGGIFKTTDAAVSWNPIFDEQEMLSIGDIEISKSDNNLIYVGTGEVNAGGGSLAYDGNGIYKSMDAGDTWENKGLEDVGSISKVLINPVDNNVVYAGVMGALFRKDIHRGVYRSLNGGESWDKVLFVSDSTGIIDMAINPISPSIVYAASWERIRRPNYRSYGGETSRIYRSTDAGETWNELTNGLPSIANQKGRISIDISYSNPNILYASYTDKTGYLQGVYKTTNGGDTWSTINSDQIYDTSYHWWFGGIFINPSNPQNIYYAGFNLSKSTDGGINWESDNTMHVDQHTVAFNAQISNQVLIGNDGGLYKSCDSGTSFTFKNDLPITQFYRYTVDEQNENKRYGGAQDNNTIRTITGAIDDWYSIYGGDGFQPLVDPTNTNTIYALYQRGNLARSTDDAGFFSPILNGISYSDRNNWDTPICIDPSNTNTLYYGTHRVYKTTNRGDDWVAISTDLTNGDPGGNLAFGTLTSIDVSPLDSNVIYAGTDDANVWVTVDGGSNWVKISDDLPTHWVTKVKASPDDVNTIYVTFSGYRYGDDDGQVFVSYNQGADWSNISTSLPDIPVNDIEIDTFGNLFIATDIGVLLSNNDGTDWGYFGGGFPSVVVTDLYCHKTSKYLYAATYGRSSYRIDLNNNIILTESQKQDIGFDMYPNPANEKLTIKFEKITNPTIEIFDLQGKLIQRIKQIKKDRLILNTKNLKDGMYFLKLENNQSRQTKKLIIKH
jgi:photosystem II stability/assembly factor-like uncharacterized protein